MQGGEGDVTRGQRAEGGGAQRVMPEHVVQAVGVNCPLTFPHLPKPPAKSPQTLQAHLTCALERVVV